MTGSAFPDLLSDRVHTVCFSGHRPGKLPGDGTGQALLELLNRALEQSIGEGARIFTNGCTAGWYGVH